MASGEDSGPKEFDPTPSKLRKLRQQGQVPKSREVAQVATFFVAVIFIILLSSYIWQQIYSMFNNLWKMIPASSLGEIGTALIAKNTLVPFFMIVLPLFLSVSITAISMDVWQVGFLFSTQVFTPKLNNLNPINNLKNKFSLQQLVEITKQIIKVAILSGVAYMVLQAKWASIIALLNVESVFGLGKQLKELIIDFVIQVTVAMFLVSLADFAFQRFNFTKKNKMTRKELLDDMKESEGDPQMKAKRKQMARQMIQRAQMSNVPSADFITTNPHKIAIAVKYDNKLSNAPIVVAKGADSIAWEIILLAKKYEIPIIENIPLARALYKLVEVQEQVPSSLYRAVAEILVFVYQIRAKAQNEKRKKVSMLGKSQE